MEFLIVSLTALIASTLTLFSGFGLGTLLMPVVAIFFPVEIAIAITAVVHLANNLFKMLLLGRRAELSILIRFGIPAVAAALVGAFLLTWLAAIPPILTYTVFDRSVAVFPIKLVIGLLILSFVLLELSPRFATLAIDKKYLPYGGVASGFFGGLSGHQGAFRSLFLIKAGLTKEQFVATSALLAVMVDAARMLVYGWDLSTAAGEIEWSLVAAATLSAFAGTYLGTGLLKKTTFRTVQLAVSGLLIAVSLGLMFGLL